MNKWIVINTIVIGLTMLFPPLFAVIFLALFLTWVVEPELFHQVIRSPFLIKSRDK